MHAALSRHAPKAKPVAAIIATGLCLTIVAQQIAHVPLSDIRAALTDIAPLQWMIAGLATLCSFWAVGHYDVVWHRHLRTGVPDRKAHRTGMAAVAIGQTVGLGVVTGSFVRWHLSQTTGFKSATAVTIGVSLSFFATWGLLVLPAAAGTGHLHPALALSSVLFALYALPIALRHLRQTRLQPHMPRLLSLTTIDLACAGLALWAMIPDAGWAFLPLIIAAYVLALGAGLISNAPGGLGAFEMVLVLTITTIPEAALIAAVLAFRLIYYVIPALIAAFVLLRAYRQPAKDTIQTTTAPISDLCYQGATIYEGIVQRRHLLGTVSIEATGALPARATRQLGFCAFYKCDGRVAAQARRQGWTVRHIADDAVIDPTTWTTEGPTRRQLRRKLKQSESAGIVIRENTGALPRAEMTMVADDWSRTHGGELGYAMGRYDPDYAAGQRVFLIYQQTQLCGFITVQTRADAWAVDLIRHVPQIPQGAMHAAIVDIIQASRAAGVSRLSLGAVPSGPVDNRLQDRIVSQKAGLRQFKASFGPRWSPRYHAAPGRLQWLLSISLIFLHIQRPWGRASHLLNNSRGEFIKFTRNFHLNPRRAHVTDGTNAIPDKAAPHDNLILEIAG